VTFNQAMYSSVSLYCCATEIAWLSRLRRARMTSGIRICAPLMPLAVPRAAGSGPG
jgi:hypothetical protein